MDIEKNLLAGTENSLFAGIEKIYISGHRTGIRGLIEQSIHRHTEPSMHGHGEQSISGHRDRSIHGHIEQAIYGHTENSLLGDRNRSVLRLSRPGGRGAWRVVVVSQVWEEDIMTFSQCPRCPEDVLTPRRCTNGYSEICCWC